MSQPLSVHDHDDIQFQEKAWAVQRAAWVLVACVLVAAVLGVFGAGPLSERTESSSDGSVTVEYERFIRHVGTTTLTITPAPATVEGGKVTVRIARDLVTGWRIEGVTPAPSAESSDVDWLIWEFDALGADAPVVKVLYRGDGFGSHEGAIRAGDGSALPVTQLIYP